MKKRNTYTIEYKKNGVLKFGLVQYYVFLSHNVLLAVVKELETLNVTCKGCFQLTSSALDTVSSLGKIYPVRRTASLCVIGVRDIVQKCLFIDFVDFSEQFVVKISPL